MSQERIAIPISPIAVQSVAQRASFGSGGGVQSPGSPNDPIKDIAEAFAKELPDDVKAAFEIMGEHVIKALNRMDETREEIEASFARTQQLKEETERLLSSVKAG